MKWSDGSMPDKGWVWRAKSKGRSQACLG